MTVENPGISQLGDCLMKAQQPDIASNEIGRIAQQVREGEGRKEKDKKHSLNEL